MEVDVFSYSYKSVKINDIYIVYMKEINYGFEGFNFPLWLFIQMKGRTIFVLNL